MEWNYLQVETIGRMLYPTLGPGGMTRQQAHARVRAFIALHAESAPYAAELLAAWDAGARDDTAFAGTLLWCIYESDDAEAGGRAWIEELANDLRASGSKLDIAW